jgi:hypothetical protein
VGFATLKEKVVVDYFLGVLNGIGGSWVYVRDTEYEHGWEFKEAGQDSVGVYVYAGNSKRRGVKSDGSELFEVWIGGGGDGEYFDVKDHGQVVNAFKLLLRGWEIDS